jgi:hypothetical protein
MSCGHLKDSPTTLSDVIMTAVHSSSNQVIIHLQKLCKMLHHIPPTAVAAHFIKSLHNLFGLYALYQKSN